MSEHSQPTHYGAVLMHFDVFFQERPEIVVPDRKMYDLPTGHYDVNAYNPEHAVYKANAIYQGYVADIKHVKPGVSIVRTHLHDFVVIRWRITTYE